MNKKELLSELDEYLKVAEEIKDTDEIDLEALPEQLASFAESMSEMEGSDDEEETEDEDDKAV